MGTATIASGYDIDKSFTYLNVITDVNSKTYMSASLPIGSVAAVVSGLRSPMAAATLSFKLASIAYEDDAYEYLSAVTIDIDRSKYSNMYFNTEVLKTDMMIMPDNDIYTIPLMAIRP
jgi:hypothetical protein